MHLFRRDRYLLTADRHLDDPAWRARDLDVALAEDAILEDGWPHTLAAAGLRLDPVQRAAWAALVPPRDDAYDSRVSRHLITQTSEAAVLAGPVIAAFAFGTGWLVARRR